MRQVKVIPFEPKYKDDFLQVKTLVYFCQEKYCHLTDYFWHLTA